MEVVYGGAKEGQFLCAHPLVRSIHLTGSAATYDAVVWGKRKKASGCAHHLPIGMATSWFQRCEGHIGGRGARRVFSWQLYPTSVTQQKTVWAYGSCIQKVSPSRRLYGHTV